VNDKEYDRLLRIIGGGLRDTIAAHGPITNELIGSATKRVLHAVLGSFAEEELKQITVRRLREKYEAENARLVKRNQRLHDAMRKLVKRRDA